MTPWPPDSPASSQQSGQESQTYPLQLLIGYLLYLKLNVRYHGKKGVKEYIFCFEQAVEMVGVGFLFRHYPVVLLSICTLVT